MRRSSLFTRETKVHTGDHLWRPTGVELCDSSELGLHPRNLGLAHAADIAERGRRVLERVATRIAVHHVALPLPGNISSMNVLAEGRRGRWNRAQDHLLTQQRDLLRQQQTPRRPRGRRAALRQRSPLHPQRRAPPHPPPLEQSPSWPARCWGLPDCAPPPWRPRPLP